MSIALNTGPFRAVWVARWFFRISDKNDQKSDKFTTLTKDSRYRPHSATETCFVRDGANVENARVQQIDEIAKRLDRMPSKLALVLIGAGVSICITIVLWLILMG